MSGKKASLAELMGKVASRQGMGGLALSQLPEILGDAMPDLPKNPMGRHRLVRSLQQRFGPNWRSLPGVNGLVKQFDEEINTSKRIAQLKALKPRR